MDATVAALLGGITGAILGATGSIASAWLQQRHQTRRDRVKLAADLGLAEFNQTRERLAATPGGGPLPPCSLFIAYYTDVLEALELGELDASRITEIEARQHALFAALPLRFKPTDDRPDPR